MNPKGFRSGSIAFTLLFLATLLLEGCLNKYPPLSAVIAPPLPNTDISQFQIASWNVNPTLTNALKGFFLDGSYGFETDTLALAPPPSGDSNAYAAHLTGTYIDYGNGGYPAFELEGFPRNNNSYYTIPNGITGIQFMWNCPTDDNSDQRFFCLITARFAPPGIGGDGTCGTTAVGAQPCYDYLSYALPHTGPLPGSWVEETVPFSSLTLQYNSGGITPADDSSVLQFMWTSRSNNNANGLGSPQNYKCDFWLDNVQLY